MIGFAGSTSSSRNMSVPGTETTADITGLRPAAGYDVYLIAENAIGASGPGRSFHFKTDEEGKSYIFLLLIMPIIIKIMSYLTRLDRFQLSCKCFVF